MEQFITIVKESENFEIALKKASEIKNVPLETASFFWKRYNPTGKLSVKESFKIFYDEHKQKQCLDLRIQKLNEISNSKFKRNTNGTIK